MASEARVRIVDKYQAYKMERKLKEGYSGGEELRRAMAALAGPRASKEASLAPTEDGSEAISPRALPLPLPINIAEVSDPQMRELVFAAQRYGAAGVRDPTDFEALYNHGLALQELALHCSETREKQEKLLRQAAERYESAWKLRQNSHAALYNWGVALSDMARVVKPQDRDQAHQYLRLSAEKYSLSLQWNPRNPQALNNWALVLQELATLQPPTEQRDLVHQSILRFRQAIRLRPDFDRACYNLGTVFYAHACSQQSSITQRLPSRLTQDPEHAQSEKEGEATAQQTFGLAAQYILLAHALQPAKEVYKKSLHVIKPLLPLPYLRSSPLATLSQQKSRPWQEKWETRNFVLDVDSLRPSPISQTGEVSGPQISASLTESHSGPIIPLTDIKSVRRCLDPSLPAGHTFWIGLASNPKGIYFVADDEAEAEGWVDSLLLCAHVANIKQLEVLADALERPEAKPPQPKTTDR